MPVIHQKDRQLSPVRNTELLKCMAYMFLDGVHANSKVLRNGDI